MVGRPDFPSIFSVKSKRFFACKSGLIREIFLIWALLKDFSPLLELGTKDIFYHLKGDVTNNRMGVVPSWAVSGDT